MDETRDKDRQEAFLRSAMLVVLSATTVAAAVISGLLGVRWDFSGFGLVAAVALPWLVVGILMRRQPRLAALGECCALFATLLGTAMSGGVIAVMSTRSPAPLGDQMLVQADWMLGLSASHFVTSVATGPSWVIEMLSRAYVSTSLLTFATLLILPLIGHKLAAMRFMLLFQLTVLSASLVAFLLPAYGAFATIDPATVGSLPDYAGRYFWPAFTAFRMTSEPVLALESISAVVSFPSFHAVMALMYAQAWNRVRGVNVIVVVISALVLVSTIPMGGHYFADVIGGLILWWSWSHLLDAAQVRQLNWRLSSPSSALAAAIRMVPWPKASSRA